MMGRKQKQEKINCGDSFKFANDLNIFYRRFDTHDFKLEREQVCNSLEPSILTLQKESVTSSLAHINPNKAPGSLCHLCHVIVT